jgi:leucyl/phenylalanyl-tRNA--protein transferase
VVGVGADLAPGTLAAAYRTGIFPWPHPGVALPWFSPDPRGVIRPGALHVSRSLARQMRTCGWTTTVDRAFCEVVAACAARRGPDGTWITRSMARAYVRLHELGWAHSVEVWDGDALVGGVYGVQLGAVFTGESMFYRAPDASKIALVDLCARFAEAGGLLLDTQLTTPHLRRLGAADLPRERFLQLLAAGRDADVRMLAGRVAVTCHATTLRHGTVSSAQTPP